MSRSSSCFRSRTEFWISKQIYLLSFLTQYILIFTKYMSPLLLFFKLMNKLLHSNCLEIKQTQATDAKLFFRGKKTKKIFTVKTTKSSKTIYVFIYVYIYIHAYIDKHKYRYTYIYTHILTFIQTNTEKVNTINSKRSLLTAILSCFFLKFSYENLHDCFQELLFV